MKTVSEYEFWICPTAWHCWVVVLQTVMPGAFPESPDNVIFNHTIFL